MPLSFLRYLSRLAAILVAATAIGGATFNVTIPFTISPPSAVALDSTIFTGSNTIPSGVYDGTTLIANVSGCSPASNCSLGGANAAKFQIVDTSWRVGSPGQPGYRGPVTLLTRGNQGRCSGGCAITINGVPFTLTDPPYAMRGNVVQLGNGSSIQNAITAASNTTILLASGGNYSGSFNMKSGVDVVCATQQNNILGHTSPASIDAGGGQIVLASNSIIYGCEFHNTGGGEGGSFPMNGTDGAQFVNNVFNGSGNNVGICKTSSNNGVVAWNTFNNFGGNDNNCTGGDQNFLNTHNALHFCNRDCEGGTLSGTNNIQYIDNFADRPGQNCGGCGTASYIEVVGPQPGGSSGTLGLYGNWISYNGGNVFGPYHLSMIACGTTEQAYNYVIDGPTRSATEWDPHIHDFPSFTFNAHDNYYDGSNGGCGGCNQGIVFHGPYGSNNVSGSQIKNNNEIPGVNDQCVDVGGQPCDGTQYIAGTSINHGVAPAFAAGSGAS